LVSVDLSKAAEDAARRANFMRKPIESTVPADKREKVLQVLSRFVENFARIEKAKLHENITIHKFPGFDGPGLDEYINQANDRSGRDLLIECSRTPLSFRTSGTLRGQQVDDSVGTGGWALTAAGKIPVESAVSLYIDWGVTEFQANDLQYDLAIQEDVPLDEDFLKLDAVKEFIRDPGARYDVLKIYENGFEYSQWINRDTGMFEYALAKVQNPKPGKPPFFMASVFDYQKTGNIYYLKTVQKFVPAQGWSGAIGDMFERGFQVREERTFTGVEINGVPAQ
jgi:hypothetical protein